MARIEGSQREGENRVGDRTEDLPCYQQPDHAKSAHLKSKFLEPADFLFRKEQRDCSEAVQRWHWQKIEEAQQQIQGKHHAQESGGPFQCSGSYRLCKVGKTR